MGHNSSVNESLNRGNEMTSRPSTRMRWGKHNEIKLQQDYSSNFDVKKRSFKLVPYINSKFTLLFNVYHQQSCCVSVYFLCMEVLDKDNNLIESI